MGKSSSGVLSLIGYIIVIGITGYVLWKVGLIGKAFGALQDLGKTDTTKKTTDDKKTESTGTNDAKDDSKTQGTNDTKTTTEEKTKTVKDSEKETSILQLDKTAAQSVPSTKTTTTTTKQQQTPAKQTAIAVPDFKTLNYTQSVDALLKLQAQNKSKTAVSAHITPVIDLKGSGFTSTQIIEKAKTGKDSKREIVNISALRAAGIDISKITGLQVLGITQ